MASLMMRLVRFGFVLAALLTLVGSAKAQAAGSDDSPSNCLFPDHASLTVGASSNHYPTSNLLVCFDRQHENVIRERAPKAIGCLPDDVGIEDRYGIGLWGLSISCTAKLDSRAFWSRGSVNPAELGALLRDAGVKSLDIHLEFPSGIQHSCEPAPKRSTDRECFYSYSRVGALEHDVPSAIRFGYGFELRALIWIAAALGTLVLLPLAVIFWFRFRTAHVKPEEITTLVFAHRRFLWIVTVGGIFSWWAAVDLLHFDEAWRLIVFEIVPKMPFRVAVSTVISSFSLIPPFVVLLACSILSAPVTRLRGIHQTRRQIVFQSLWSVARIFVPVAFIGMILPLIASDVRWLLVMLVVFIFLMAWIQRRYAKSLGVQLQSLTSGTLRDRAFAMAAAAKTNLNQIYLMPTEQMRMANAYAHAGRNIFLTDYLLKNLNRHEVDAIVAHEVSHLKSKHILWRVLGVFTIAAAVGVGSEMGGKVIPEDFPLGPVAFAAFVLALYFISRRNEFAADAGSVKITGDAASLITGLAKVTSLNSMPIHWGKLDEKMLTHPSTLRRIKRLAKLGGIPEAQIPELLDQAKKPAEDVYEIPPGALSAGRVYSSQYKAAGGQRLGWLILAAIAAAPSIAAVVARFAHLEEWALGACYLAGFAAAIGAAITLQNFLPCRGSRKLEARLRAKFSKEDGRETPREGILVSVSPDAAPRLFESSWAWDMGIATVERDCFVYRGEETRFALRRDLISNVYLGQGPIGWLKPPALYIETKSDDGPSETFGLLIWRGKSMVENARLLRSLFAGLVAWRRGDPLPKGLPISLATSGATESNIVKIGEVTSTSPKALARVGMLIRTFYVDCFVGAAIAVMFGFRLGFMESEPTAANSNGWVFVYVIFAMWLTHLVLFLPFWFYREPAQQQHKAKSEPVATQVA